MLIQLKQKEIEKALAMYIEAQGISLVNKTVYVTFTAGRRDAGLTADVEIEQISSTTPTPQDGAQQFRLPSQNYIVDEATDYAAPEESEALKEAEEATETRTSQISLFG